MPVLYTLKQTHPVSFLYTTSVLCHRKSTPQKLVKCRACELGKFRFVNIVQLMEIKFKILMKILHYTWDFSNPDDNFWLACLCISSCCFWCLFTKKKKKKVIKKVILILLKIMAWDVLGIILHWHCDVKQHTFIAWFCETWRFLPLCLAREAHN
jgi:hypothetical protein